MKITRIELNTWIIQIAGQTILIDPWLVDPMTFYGFPWLFTADHITPPLYTPETLPPIDLILLSQGLDDHCHKPTLEKLDRSIPVVASLTAAKVVKSLGYTQVKALSAWQEYNLPEKLQITATPGALLQGQVENGYLIKELLSGGSVYYEPHLFCPQAGIQERLGRVDVAIAPVVGQVFPLLGQVVMSPIEAIALVKTLNPRFFVPTSMGEIRESGLLPRLIKSVGSLAEFKNLLENSGLPTQLLTPAPGETLSVEF